jgi:hypothetical protein
MNIKSPCIVCVLIAEGNIWKVFRDSSDDDDNPRVSGMLEQSRLGVLPWVDGDSGLDPLRG